MPGPVNINPKDVFSLIPVPALWGGCEAFVGLEKTSLIISAVIDWFIPLTIGFHIQACKSPADTDSGKAWRKLALINSVVGILGMIIGIGYFLIVINAVLLVLIALDENLIAACADQAALDAYSGSWTDGKAADGTPVVEDLEA